MSTSTRRLTYQVRVRVLQLQGLRDGKTTQYEVARKQSLPLPQGTVIAVWPATAAPAIEVNHSTIDRKACR